MVGSNLHRFYKGLYVFLDLETENVNLRFNKPWQASFIIADNKEIKEQYDYYLFWDDLNMSEGAKIVTRFNYPKYIDKAVAPRKVLEKLDSFIQDDKYRIVGHNLLGFDTFVYNAAKELVGMDANYSYLDRVIDTNCLMKGYKKGFKPDTENFLEWQFKMSNYIEKGLKTNLAQSGRDFNIQHDYESLHDGLVDIHLNYKVYKELLYKLDF